MKKYVKLLSGAMLVVALAACGDEKEHSHKEDVHTHEEISEQAHAHEESNEHAHEHAHEQIHRIVATSDKGIHILNEKFEEIRSISFEKGGLSTIGDSPYLFVKNKEKNDSYQFLHSGVWIEDHGDHDHPYEEDAKIYDAIISANQPAHVVSFENQVAVFNDGSGAVQVYQLGNHSIENEPKLSYEYKGIAHHGIAIPMKDQKLAVSYPANEGDRLPNGVKIVDKDGKEQAVVTSSCEQLHGAAYSNEFLAFGCQGKVVLYDMQKNESKDIELKNKENRVSSIYFSEDSDYLFTNYFEEGKPLTEIGIINRKNGEMSYVTLPAAYKSAFLATKDYGYVLAEDGYLYEIDYKGAQIKTKIHALNPFDLTEESPSVHAMNDHIYIVMPSYEKVYEVHGNHTHEAAKLSFIPTSFIVK